MKILVSVILLLLCWFSLDVFGSGSDQSEPNSNQSNNPENPNPLKHLEDVVKSLQEKNREQEKINQELKEEMKKLSDKVDQLETKMSSDDHGLWLLTPPVRGPRGRDGVSGQKGDKGSTGQNGNSGQNGRAGERDFKGDRGTPGPKGDQGPIDPHLLKSCSNAMEFLPSPRSQRQSIYPHENGNKVEVLCDFETDGGGWTVIQKRSSGPQDEFYRSWTEYANGFGSVGGNFWIGLDNIRALTQNGDQELRIELEDFGGNEAYAKYSSFSVSNASDFYRLAICGFYGDSTAGDSMTGSWNINGAKFSTNDNDKDGGSHNCAQLRHGAWWYKNVEWACAHSNLNGIYRQPGESFPPGKGLVWESWRGATTSLKKVQMKIRKRN